MYDSAGEMCVGQRSDERNYSAAFVHAIHFVDVGLSIGQQSAHIIDETLLCIVPLFE